MVTFVSLMLAFAGAIDANERATRPKKVRAVVAITETIFFMEMPSCSVLTCSVGRA
jgi:hypothetical protein